VTDITNSELSLTDLLAAFNTKYPKANQELIN